MKNDFSKKESIVTQQEYLNHLLKNSRFLFFIFSTFFSTVLFAQQTITEKVTSGDTEIIIDCFFSYNN